MDLPGVHAVDKWRSAISGPDALIGELGDIPHHLVHDLGNLDWECRWASSTTIGSLS
jgi:hypothetical protein